MIYLLIGIYICVCVWLYDYRREERGKRVAWIVLFAVLVVTATLRYRIGIDSLSYEYNYRRFPGILEIFSYDYTSELYPGIPRYEPLFPIFLSIPRTFSDNFMWAQCLESIVVNLAVFRLVRRYCSNGFLALGLYYIFCYTELNFEVMRQAFAISLFLFAWPSFSRGDWLKYYLIVATAPFVHYSGVILYLLPLGVLPGVRELFRFGRRTIVLLACSVGIGYLIRIGLPGILGLLADFPGMEAKIRCMIEYFPLEQNLNWKGVSAILLKYVLPVSGAMVYLRVRQPQLLNKVQFPSLAMLYIVIMSMPIGMVMLRFSYYFIIFAMILVAQPAFRKWPLLKLTSSWRLRVPQWGWMAVIAVMCAIEVHSYLRVITADGDGHRYDMYYPYNNRLNPRHIETSDTVFGYFRDYK